MSEYSIARALQQRLEEKTRDKHGDENLIVLAAAVEVYEAREKGIIPPPPAFEPVPAGASRTPSGKPRPGRKPRNRTRYGLLGQLTGVEREMTQQALRGSL